MVDTRSQKVDFRAYNRTIALTKNTLSSLLDLSSLLSLLHSFANGDFLFPNRHPWRSLLLHNPQMARKQLAFSILVFFFLSSICDSPPFTAVLAGESHLIYKSARFFRALLSFGKTISRGGGWSPPFLTFCGDTTHSGPPSLSFPPFSPAWRNSDRSRAEVVGRKKDWKSLTFWRDT